MRYLALFSLLGMLLLCGCPKKQTVQGPARESLTEAQPSAQPETPAPPTPPAIRPQSGWRVQVFASSTRENARRVAEEARWKFVEHQVFIIEQDGLHKVQVGNGLSRIQADQLKNNARMNGYPGAFAVEVILGP